MSKPRSHLFLLSNAFNKDLKFTNKEISVIVHWFKQIIGLFVGILCGAIPFTGFVGFLIFGAICVSLTTFYYTKLLEVEDGDFKWELMQEGFMSALAIFVITWILVYNIYHV
ncbi:hypothetical protein CYY_005199 [Polysphondylium violaceum]|uniref:Rab5-interacting protein n=1 Tax=Polysphondylium violaceum TaxID=133409 RepID=A0A8J4PUN4_9MYCE|nr:hypothetical protein CYY_005199 [Polysphondylium violaceum]